MRERPIGDLVVGLKQLGADVDCFLGTDCPPVRVKGIGGLPGGKVSYYGAMGHMLHSSVNDQTFCRAFAFVRKA